MENGYQRMENMRCYYWCFNVIRYNMMMFNVQCSIGCSIDPQDINQQKLWDVAGIHNGVYVYVYMYTIVYV